MALTGVPPIDFCGLLVLFDVDFSPSTMDAAATLYNRFIDGHVYLSTAFFSKGTTESNRNIVNWVKIYLLRLKRKILHSVKILESIIKIDNSCPIKCQGR